MLTGFTGLLLSLFPRLTAEILPSLFRTVLEISLTTGILIALLLLLRPLLKKHYRAGWMYALWLVLAVRLVVPVNFSLPTAPMSVSAPSVTIYRHETARTNPGSHEFVLLSPEDYRQAREREDTAAGGIANGHSKNYYSPLFPLSQVFALIWCGGMAVVLMVEAISYARFRRRVRRWRKEEDDPTLLARFEALKAALGVKKLALARCSAISSPMVTGFRKPALLLPEGDVPQAVLCHELVHAKRGDLWYKLLLVFARSVHWFNPLVWLMARQAAQDLELSCDEAVVAGQSEAFRAGYGRAILDAVDSGGGREAAPLTTYFHGGKKAMLERLQSILNTKARRRGAVALALVALLAVSVSAVCAIHPATQKIDGGAYTLSIPTDTLSSSLTEVMPDDTFSMSYYETRFHRYSGSGHIRRLSIPGFSEMGFEARAEALHPTDKALGAFQFTPYTSPGGIEGLMAEGDRSRAYYFPLGGDRLLEFWLSMGSKGTGHQNAYFTEDEAMLSSLTLGYSLTPAPRGNLALSYEFIEHETVWYLWDMGGRNPKLLGRTAVPSEQLIVTAPIWSEDGRWAAVPSSDDGLRWNWRVFSVGEGGFAENFPVVPDAEGFFGEALSALHAPQDYHPLPHTLELRAIEFSQDARADYPSLQLHYSLLDDGGALQSGRLAYSCVPPEAAAALTGFFPISYFQQDTPYVHTTWRDEYHSFSLPLPRGSRVSPADSSGARHFLGPNGEALGRIYTDSRPPDFNSGALRLQDGAATYLFAWSDPAHGLYYHLDLRQAEDAPPLTPRMMDALTVDGAAVVFYTEP